MESVFYSDSWWVAAARVRLMADLPATQTYRRTVTKRYSTWIGARFPSTIHAKAARLQDAVYIQASGSVTIACFDPEQ